ncbi:MAG: hypothetical protein IJA47_03595 [Oscillospiraceae bacterium]|nr:hypothetical protein [Oscillospiraceae bacterium]
MAGEFRNLTPEENEICRENNVVPKGMNVVLSNDRCLWLLNHTTRDEIHIVFGEKRAQKKAVPITAQG